MPKSLGTIIAEIAVANPDRPALWAKGELVTYHQLLESASRLAFEFRSAGVCHGDRVAILSERSTTPYIAILGALLAGAAYVPLNVRYPEERNRRILESSGASILLCSDRQEADARRMVDRLTDITMICARNALTTFSSEKLHADLEVDAASLAYVFFTSGTTGTPKGVPITHANVLSYLRGIKSFVEIGPDDRVMQVVDLTFDLSVHDIFLAWTAGACLFSIPENGTLLCTRFVEEHSGTHWLSVPSAAALVKQTGLLTPGSMPTLKYSLFCGEALPGTVAENWATAAPNSKIFNIYGPTEATVAFSAAPYVPGQAYPPAIVSLGSAFPEQRMGLFDENGCRIDDGVGEICLAGSQLTDGYWNAPQITAERFFEAEGERWYRTGDLGKFVPGEGYAFLGRSDRQVKIRGYRVELQEIENAVREAAASDIAAVVLWPLDKSGAAMGNLAFVVGGVVDGTTLARVGERLPDYMVPSKIERLAALPLNANGKIDHRALGAAVVERLQSGREDFDGLQW